MKILKAKVTKSYDLSVSVSELVKEYPHSPAFNSIYSYITQNDLPKDKTSQRMVITYAENYIVVNGILFKLVKDKRTFDTPIKCLLVAPEKFENSVFHMFHDTLLGAHYGQVTHITLLRTDIGYTTCLKNYKDTYPPVMHANNKSRKEVRLNIFIQGYLSATIQ